MRTLPLKLNRFLLLALALAMSSQAAPYREHKLALPFAMGQEGKGGILTADMNNDGKLDLLVSAPGQLAAIATDGHCLWHRKVDIRVSAGSSERYGLPGHDAPGAQVYDIDGDGRMEVLFLDQSNTIHILSGDTGASKSAIRIPNPKGSERWEHMAVVDLRGAGDKDIVLQCTNAKGYRVGHYLAAYSIDKGKACLLWSNDRFGALAHGPFRAADLNADGRDEICGFTILGPDGGPTGWNYPPINKKYAGGASFHIDSIFIYDVRPEIPGLEVVLLEEGRNYTALANFNEGLLWWTTNKRQEPQNAAVGEFSLEHPGLEIWCRSRYNTHQKPWVLDAQGKIIAAYDMVACAPKTWTTSGVEVIVPIDWSGTRMQLAAAKERHESGDVGLFEPMTGQFVLHIPAQADRLYVADISGDWREEMIIVEGRQIRIFENTNPNPRPQHPRLWQQQNYRRNKMSWNYYSP
jgi:hypothetical protein